MAEEYKLNDVNPEAPLRVYTDTPFKLDSSCKEPSEGPGSLPRIGNEETPNEVNKM